jgi:serine/threonine-protein kinase
MSRDYAAPEWLRDGTVGFQIDVYSLGVILYETLTGRLPENNADHPEKPSAVAPPVPRLSKRAWSDLDVLCLKAMHKDPDERYPSVEALIRDIDHYLKGEPLEARPDRVSYRLGKFVRRNRSAVVATSFVVTLVIGLVSFFMLRLATARNSVLAEAVRTQRVERFIENLFEGGDKDAGPSDDLRVVTLLDRGVQQAQDLNRDPVVQAELYETLGTIYRKLGKLERADSLLQSALERRKSIGGSNESAIADSLLALGLLRTDQARLPEAERLIRETLALDQRRRPSDQRATARATAALGRVLEERGQHQQAIEILNQAIGLQSAQGLPNTDVAESLTLLADAHFYLGDYPASDSLNRQALTMRQQLYGPRHPLAAQNFINLGHVQIQLGHYPEAEQHFRRALAIDQSWYGKDHPESARAENYIAQALNWQSRYEESRSLLEHALVVFEHAYGKAHPRVALVVSSLGFVAIQLGKQDEAEAYFVRMAAIYRSVYGDQHQLTALALVNLASVYLKTEQYSRAERLLRDAIQVYARVLPAGHLNTAIAQIKLGRALVRQKRYQEAEEHTLAGYAILTKQASPSLDFLQGARADLVRIYDALGPREKATRFRTELAANEPRKVDLAKRK